MIQKIMEKSSLTLDRRANQAFHRIGQKAGRPVNFMLGQRKRMTKVYIPSAGPGDWKALSATRKSIGHEDILLDPLLTVGKTQTAFRRRWKRCSCSRLRFKGIHPSADIS